MTPKEMIRRAARRHRDSETFASLPEHERAAIAEHRRTQSLRTRLRKFGLTPEQYEDMVLIQGGRCATCRRLPSPTTSGRRTLVVDHCHETGVTRGLLCSRCNTVLGQLRDDPQTLSNMIRYLETHSK